MVAWKISLIITERLGYHLFLYVYVPVVTVVVIIIILNDGQFTSHRYMFKGWKYIVKKARANIQRARIDSSH